MKITTSTNNIKSFGGLNLISVEFDQLQLHAPIGKEIVYIEKRNGNSNVKFKQTETPKVAYEMLKKRKYSNR